MFVLLRGTLYRCSDFRVARTKSRGIKMSDILAGELPLNNVVKIRLFTLPLKSL